METRYIAYTSGKPSLLRKTAAVAVFAVTAVAAVMFSAVLLAFLLLIGAIAGLYFWWKMRGVRKQMQEFRMQEFRTQDEFEAHDEGIVIEGEAVRVDPKRDAP